MPDTDPEITLGETLPQTALPSDITAAFLPGPGVHIHPTALIERGVVLGRGSSVWDNVHIRHDTIIGDECIIGEKTYIAYGVRIGNRCKINSFVYICTAVTLDDGVMVSAGTIFTNDRFPRATTPDLSKLRTSDPDEHTRPTRVREGATIGAGCVIGNDLTIGRFAMIGMGAVVTHSIPDFVLAVGNPAVPVGAVCRCGQLLLRHPAGQAPHHQALGCCSCGRQYEYRMGQVVERLTTRAAN
jgi:acetyltransferase-like isoleucine patch superfamily enzyme